MVRVFKISLSILMTILLSAAAFEGVSTAQPSATVPDYQGQTAPREGANEHDLSHTIGVLESRIGSHRIPAQAKEKLAAMDWEEQRLIAALCDRMARSGDSPGSDLALLLAVALIVLS